MFNRLDSRIAKFDYFPGIGKNYMIVLSVEIRLFILCKIFSKLISRRLKTATEHLPRDNAFAALAVLGVPVQSKALSGQDSLLSIVQMPAGVPVGTLAIGKAGATNAGLLAAAILANHDTAVSQRLQDWRAARSAAVTERPVG